MQNGYDSTRFLPSNDHGVLKATRILLGKVVKIKIWSLPILFPILFPQDPLIGQNHSGVIDAIQMAQIFRLLAKLAKAPEKRSLLDDLLRGFEDLIWLDDECIYSNTLDRYFKPVGRSASDGYLMYPCGGLGEDDMEIADEGVGLEKLGDGETNDRGINDEDIGDGKLDDKDIALEQDMHLGTLDAVANIEYKIAEQAFCQGSFVIDNHKQWSCPLPGYTQPINSLVGFSSDFVAKSVIRPTSTEFRESMVPTSLPGIW